MSLTRADREIHHNIKMMIAQHGTDMSPTTRAALDNVIHRTTPPKLNLHPIDPEMFIKISLLIKAGLQWRSWTHRDRALLVEMCRQADHMERRRVARHATIGGAQG